ncbi:MAG: hypothetical protein M3256_15590 [Actinomycetota bacterium]|nr:hypothetical protein [Actinomycetota bacterium]
MEQIIAKLREAEKLQEDEAQRLKALEQENSRLNRIVAEQAVDISMLKDLQRGKW